MNASLPKKTIILILTLSIFSIYGMDTNGQERLADVTYLPKVEAIYKGGNQRHIGQVGLLIPLLYDNNHLLYLTSFGMLDSKQAKEGNFGLGFRSIIYDQLIMGAYAFYDIRRTTNKNIAHQLTLGCELLTRHWEARGNFYIPDGKRNVATSIVQSVQYYGNSTVLKRILNKSVESSLSGIDLELGRSIVTQKVYGYIGYYYFTKRNFASIHGLRLRTRLQVHEHMSFDAEYHYDGLRGSSYYAGIRLCSKIGSKPARKRVVLREKMTSLPIRDIDIQTQMIESVPLVHEESVPGKIHLLNEDATIPLSQADGIGVIREGRMLINDQMDPDSIRVAEERILNDGECDGSQRRRLLSRMHDRHGQLAQHEPSQEHIANAHRQTTEVVVTTPSPEQVNVTDLDGTQANEQELAEEQGAESSTQPQSVTESRSNLHAELLSRVRQKNEDRIRSLQRLVVSQSSEIGRQEQMIQQLQTSVHRKESSLEEERSYSESIVKNSRRLLLLENWGRFYWKLLFTQKNNRYLQEYHDLYMSAKDDATRGRRLYNSFLRAKKVIEEKKQ